jgi:predicted ATPase
MRLIARLANLTDYDTSEVKMEKLATLLKNVSSRDPEAVALLATHLGASKKSGSSQELPAAAMLKRRRMTLNTLIISLFLLLANDGPVLIVFEDLHWMDPTTEEFLDLLIDQIKGHPIFLICTSRSEVSPHWKNAQPVALDRLTKPETVQFSFDCSFIERRLRRHQILQGHLPPT